MICYTFIYRNKYIKKLYYKDNGYLLINLKLK